MKKIKKRYFRKINTVEDMEKIFGFSAKDSVVTMHPETYKKFQDSIKEGIRKNLPEGMRNVEARVFAKTVTELFKLEHRVDYKMPRNYLRIMEK